MHVQYDMLNVSGNFEDFFFARNSMDSDRDGEIEKPNRNYLVVCLFNVERVYYIYILCVGLIVVVIACAKVFMSFLAAV